MEAAGDLSIPIQDVETAIGKLNKTIGADPDKVRDLGIDLVYLKDGSLDVNETFLNTIQRIKDIKDPAEKAKVATQLLGRSWQDMAELIEMGADDLKASLDSVKRYLAPLTFEKRLTFLKNHWTKFLLLALKHSAELLKKSETLTRHKKKPLTV
jgi:hypothetical protein